MSLKLPATAASVAGDVRGHWLVGRARLQLVVVRLLRPALAALELALVVVSHHLILLDRQLLVQQLQLCGGVRAKRVQNIGRVLHDILVKFSVAIRLYDEGVNLHADAAILHRESCAEALLALERVKHTERDRLVVADKLDILPGRCDVGRLALPEGVVVDALLDVACIDTLREERLELLPEIRAGSHPGLFSICLTSWL
jgi:hypothetical protein